MKKEKIEVKIYQPAKSAMQSGKAKRKWLIEPVSCENHRKLNKLMGWVSSNSTFFSQLEFEFTTKEEAIEFAKNKGFEYSVQEPNKASLKKKSYAANFVS
jgi:hypothetical protein